MNESLRWSAAFSFLVHVLLVGIPLLLLRQSSHFSMPTTYTVNLVSSGAGLSQVSHIEEPQGINAENESQAISAEEFEGSAMASKKDEQRLSSRLAALRKGKNIEKVVRLRNIISVKGNTGKQATTGTAKGTAGGTAGGIGIKGQGSITDNYIAQAQQILKVNWDIPPAISDKKIEAIISIRIMKDGLIQFKEIEKTSGNRLFDRSVLMAITKTNRLAPPPHEMEIGIRFRP